MELFIQIMLLAWILFLFGWLIVSVWTKDEKSQIIQTYLQKIHARNENKNSELR